MSQQYPAFDFKTPPELSGNTDTHYSVAIVGAGPIGLSAAIDLALQGIAVVVLDDNNVVSVGSRAICWAKRSLEIYDRLGVGERMLEKGVTWKTGRLFHGSDEVYNFDLLPEAGHKMPAFINLQQYHVEQYLVERAQEFPDLIDLRFKHKVVDHVIADDNVSLCIETPEGPYSLTADYVLACDGAGSPTRKRMGLSFEGQTFEERFLIADIEMQGNPFPDANNPERWFWFKPPFHEGQSALLHKQPDNIYRIDLQLGADADPVAESQPDNVIPRIKEIVGDEPFELSWVSVYKFSCAKLDQFVHGRLLFVGDSAHVVSPFGARGGNGGMHDVDNLCWKLALVVKGEAPQSLLQTYEEERGHGASENIKNSAQATRFMSPNSDMERLYRDEILDLAGDLPFARSLINSGRLSTPCVLDGMTLQSDEPQVEDADEPLSIHSLNGKAAPDLPTDNNGWLLNNLGNSFTLLLVDCDAPDEMTSIESLSLVKLEGNDYAYNRYGKGAFLIRPDQHIAARWPSRAVNVESVAAALSKACGSQRTAVAS